MSQSALFLLVVTVAGAYALRWSLRLAPLGSELPLKTLVAVLLSATVAAAGVLPYEVSDGLRALALILGPLYVFGPLLAVGLARSRWYGAANAWVMALYWLGEGRAAARRLLAQVALQQGDGRAALELIPESDPLMLAQAYAVDAAWERVLDLDLPRGSDNAYLGQAARIEALLELGRPEEAEAELSAMRARWRAGEQGPLGFRSILLSEARLAAERGDLAAVRHSLQNPPPGTYPHLLLAVLARAAERAGQPGDAARLYAQAFALAPEGMRDRYAGRLARLGESPPEVSRRRSQAIGTYSLALALVAAFLGQLAVDADLGPMQAFGQRLDASSVAAAFFLNVPRIPEGDAWWRFLSYALVHANLLHIGFNAWVLVDMGRLYEARRSWGGVLASFTLGTFMGAYLTTIAQSGESVVLVGASGGVLGVAGALLADVLRSRTGADRLLTRSLLQWMALIALLSVAIPNVSLWGHVGGVVGGLLWGFFRQGLPAGRNVDTLGGAVALSAFLAVLVQVGALLSRLA